MIHSQPASALGEVSSDDVTLLSLHPPVCVVGVGVREKGGVLTCALLVLNSRSGDSGPSHGKVALFPHLGGKFTSAGAVGVKVGLPLPDIRLERARWWAP